MWNSKNIIIILLLAQTAMAQETETNQNVPIPTITSIAFGVDYGKLFGQFLNSESKYELSGQVEFKNRVVLVGEFGLATLNPSGAYQNTDYESKGYYHRIGLGYKIDMTVKNNIYFSVRYAQARFEDSGVININSASGIYNDIVQPFERNSMDARWFEVVMSSEARLWKGLYAGFHARLRFMDKYDKQSPLDVYSVPGYGRTFDRTIPALNLYLKYALERF